MKICLISSLILSAGFQITIIAAKQTGSKNLRRGLKSSKSGNNRTYRRIKPLGNNDCVTAVGSEDNVITHTCSNNEYKQHWEYRFETNEIVNEDNNECLDLFGDGSVGTWPCHGRTNQKWEYDSDYYRFVSIDNGKCMNLINSNDIRVSDCDSSTAQKFFLDPSIEPPPPQNGTPIKGVGGCVEMSLSSDNNVSIKSCNNLIRQKWYYDSANQAFKSSENDYCLDVNEESGNVIAWPCHYRRNQQWEWFYDYNLEYHRLKSKINGDKCLDTDQNNNMMANFCHSGVSQKFTHSSVPPVAPTTKSPTKSPVQQPVSSPTVPTPIKIDNNCLGVVALNSNDVAMQSCDGDKNQNWVFSSGIMKNTYYNKCLDVDLSNGQENVIAWGECHGRDNQQWEYSSEGMKSLYNEKCMTVENDMSLKLSPCNGSPNQMFKYGNVNPPPPSTQIKNDNKCLGVVASNSEDVAMQSCDGEENQNWVFSSGIMKNTYYNKCLDVDLSNGQENVIAWSECHGRNNQRWEYSSEGMKSLYNEKCMTMENDMSLKLSPCNGSPNQMFKYADIDPPPPLVLYNILRDAMNGCVTMTSTGNVVSAPCTAVYSQDWVIEGDMIKNRLNGWCLDVDELDNNSIIAWNECHGRENQQWKFEGRVLKSMLSDSTMTMVATLNPSNKKFELQEYDQNNMYQYIRLWY